MPCHVLSISHRPVVPMEGYVLRFNTPKGCVNEGTESPWLGLTRLLTGIHVRSPISKLPSTNRGSSLLLTSASVHFGILSNRRIGLSHDMFSTSAKVLRGCTGNMHQSFLRSMPPTACRFRKS